MLSTALSNMIFGVVYSTDYLPYLPQQSFIRRYEALFYKVLGVGRTQKFLDGFSGGYFTLLSPRSGPRTIREWGSEWVGHSEVGF